MAINLNDFYFLGARGTTIRKRGTRERVCYIKNLVKINIDDSIAEDFIRGGFGNEKIDTIYGDRDASMTGSTATYNPDLIKVMSKSELVSKTKTLGYTEDLAISNGKFTLKEAPKVGTTPQVWSVDALGIEAKLTLGTATANQFAITGKDITCAAGVNNIRVTYDFEKATDTIEFKEVTSEAYDITTTLVCKKIGTSEVVECLLEVPNGTITPTFTFEVSNDGSVPAPVELKISMLKDPVKNYPYAFNFI